MRNYVHEAIPFTGDPFDLAKFVTEKKPNSRIVHVERLDHCVYVVILVRERTVDDVETEMRVTR